MSKSRKSAARPLPVRIVGHPGAANPKGERARSLFRSLREAGGDPWLVDIGGPPAEADAQLLRTYENRLSDTLGGGPNIFCIDADEVERTFDVMATRNLAAKGSKSILYPAWDLSRFPSQWSGILDRFDEIWAPSAFIADAIAPLASVPVRHMPLACEVGERGLLSRRHFNIPDSSYCFLASFDSLPGSGRKGLPVIHAFRELVRARPGADVRLVLQLGDAQQSQDLVAKLTEAAGKDAERVIFVHGALSELETKALIWTCDCYVSLHRSEEFGRGLAQAMALGKPVIATEYSGNMDFCSDATAFLVPFELVPVGAGEHPYWQGQEWAEPDIEAAAKIMATLADQPQLGVEKGRSARAQMLARFSFLSRGFDYLKRCEELSI